MMSRPEQLQFLAYVSRFPIDDESNHHVPIAQLTALYANVHRDKAAMPDPIRLDEFLINMPDPVDALEDTLDRDIARFFMRGS